MLLSNAVSWLTIALREFILSCDAIFLAENILINLYLLRLLAYDGISVFERSWCLYWNG